MRTLPQYSILQVNKSTRIDVELYLASTYALDIYGIISREDLIKFLETLPGEQGFMAVRRLHFWNFSGEIQTRPGIGNENIDLMRRCTGLIHVRLHFNNFYLLRDFDPCKSHNDNEATPGNTPVFLTSEEVARRYCLEQLFELDNLETLVLRRESIAQRLHGVAGDEWVLFNSGMFLKDLGSWIQDGFSRRGKRIEVKYDGI